MSHLDIPFFTGPVTNLPATAWAYIGEDGQNILRVNTPMEYVEHGPFRVGNPAAVAHPSRFPVDITDLDALRGYLRVRADALAAEAHREGGGWSMGLAVHAVSEGRALISLYAWRSAGGPVDGPPLREAPFMGDREVRTASEMLGLLRVITGA